MIKSLPVPFFRDDAVRRIGRNVGYLLSANMAVAVLGLFTLAIMARALGPAGLGILALIEAYARTVDRFLHFEAWQTLVRFGASALHDKRERDFKQLVKYSFLFDLAGAAFAGTAAIFGLSLAARWLSLDDGQQVMAATFSATLFLNLSSAPTAVLRLFDKFALTAKISVATASIRLLLTLLAWALDGGLWAFVLILIAYQLSEQIALLVFSWRELKRQGHDGIWREPLRGIGKNNPGLLSFLWNVNINVIARTGIQQIDVLIVGAFLEPKAVGLFQIAKRVGLASLRLGRPIQQAIYPDFSRLWASGETERFRRIVWRAMIFMGATATAAFLVLSLKIDFFIDLAFGASFVSAAPAVLAQLLAAAIFLTGNTLGPALMSMGEDRRLMRATLSASALFLIAIVPLIELYGPLGASLAHLLFNSLWLAACLWAFRTGVKRPEPLSAAGSAI